MSTTIFALSSGPPPSGIAVIRVSGDQAGAALRALTVPDLPKARFVSRQQLHRPDAASGDTSDALDDALVIWMPGPATFTGEDCAEFHVHGGRAVVAAVLAALGTVPGLRLAHPGEFSRRAYENGKLDLSEAEGLADLIAAETEAQRRQAMRQLDGSLGQQCLSWQGQLKSALAHMEATIDFSDEELPDSLDGGARDQIAGVLDQVRQSLDDANRGERLRHGLRVAIVGPPNAGKSSLLNRLAGREAAIVSEHAGTTRDVIEVHLEMGGYSVALSDTAGLRDSDDSIEQEGVRRAESQAEEADFRIVVLDGGDWPHVDPLATKWLDQDAIGVVNKTDLLDRDADLQLNGLVLTGISVQSGEGVEGLIDQLEDKIAARWGQAEGAIITRARHREALTECAEHLQRTLGAAGSELWAEDLRLSMRALGRVVGQVGVEDVLDVIFSEFCIGK
ncbi:MAG: tRNA uridine-5-carboxymethylaminomethyl(34) synthesis GTPase MnmE [Rhodospirillales bacterium]|nr:tRNA uridine-5-carboxymethylaminomethyl(34) synthesis GTPase MnmE [Rhodospirillales bacterium]